MNIQPSSFIPMIKAATSVQAVAHIFDCVDLLFGFEYSPPVESDRDWDKLITARDEQLEILK